MSSKESTAPTPNYVQTVYLVLLLLSTLAASFIWGINTLFLLDAGLSNEQAFIANAFFTIGQVLFEVPTGVIADVKGRKVSYLLGAATLVLSTLFYVYAWFIHAPVFIWCISSVLLGLGFSFFSGATEAWLVDSLEFSGFKGHLETVFAKGQSISGVAMLAGSVLGGFLAQYTSLATPYIVRAGLLALTFIVAFIFMKDWGFEPKKKQSVYRDMKELFQSSVEFGLKKPAVRWVMLMTPFISGVSFYAFYAMQPFLLELYGNREAYGVAGLAAALVAAAQILGGFISPHFKRLFRLRTSVLLWGTVISTIFLFLISITQTFWIAILLLSCWALTAASVQPVRQSYLNQLIPSKKRATVLSFDALLGSAGGVGIQPILGKVADVYSYAISLSVGACIQSLAIPFSILARKTKVDSDAF